MTYITEVLLFDRVSAHLESIWARWFTLSLLHIVKGVLKYVLKFDFAAGSINLIDLNC